MSEPLEKLRELNVTALYVNGAKLPAFVDKNGANQIADTLNAAIDRINELEAKYESHTHGSSELLHDTYAARDNIEPADPPKEDQP